MTTLTFPLPPDTLQQFCQRWKIRELALFGSVLRTDFRPDSDIDILVTFHDDADWRLLDTSRCSTNLPPYCTGPLTW